VAVEELGAEGLVYVQNVSVLGVFHRHLELFPLEGSRQLSLLSEPEWGHSREQQRLETEVDNFYLRLQAELLVDRRY
jgi:hypothetical protein